jgi:hypothetical protein
MKSLNAKRIATVVAGAALLGLGLAFAGPVTFQNVQIISNSGQPVVQVVLGSNAKASDGVAAANIAAAIGNLAYTSVPVTASVNATQAAKVLGVSVTSAQYSLSNPQVYLNVSGSTSVTGSYVFSALIGSVLNGAVMNGVPAATKFIQGSGSNYANQELYSTQIYPIASPYTYAGGPLTYTTPQSSTSGGGVTFQSFTSGNTNGFDNILEITHNQLPTLLSNSGPYGESEYLWIAGFPVFDQQSGVNQFQLMSAQGAYQVVFSTPIQLNGTATGQGRIASAKVNAPVTLLGQSWTIVNGYGAGKANNPGVASSNVVAGGLLTLASSLTPLTTVFVGHNLTSGPFTVQLQDLGVANSNGVSPAAVAVYYNGALTNSSSISPSSIATKFNVSGHLLYVNVQSTFAGYYAYEKWAQMQVYSNVFNVTSGNQFNKTTNPGWKVAMLWTNTSVTGTGTAGNAVALESIILYNSSPTTLTPGSTFSFIESPSAYLLRFEPDSFTNYDTITAQVQNQAAFLYQNLGAATAITNISEPAQILTVSSGIPNAFQYAGPSSQSVTYDLTPYEMNAGITANVAQLGAAPVAGVTSPVGSNAVDNVILTWGGSGPLIGQTGSFISTANPLTVQINGYAATSTGGLGGAKTWTLTFGPSSLATYSGAQANAVIPALYNVTSIVFQNKAVPGPITVNVVGNAMTGGSVSNVVVLGSLTNAGNAGAVYYSSSANPNYQTMSTSTAVTYNPQNGQPTVANGFNLIGTFKQDAGRAALEQYYVYAMNEIAVPSNTQAVDTLAFGIVNSTGGPGASPIFNLNYSVGSWTVNTVGLHNNMTYIPSTPGYATLSVMPGFRTERGSKVVSITPQTVTIGLAKVPDMLNFAIGPTLNSSVTTTGVKTIGPFGLGVAVSGFANLTVSKITATPVLSGASTYSITGIGNITATPSVSTAAVPVLLDNMSTPLVVLDSAANPQSSLILVGSGYVNALSAQLQSAYSINMTPTSAPVMQAYGTNRVLIAGYYANQTTAEANAFIAQLYAKAAGK